MKKYTLLCVFVLFATSSFSQVLKKKKVEPYTGFFDFYYEEQQDKIYLEVANLDDEFLYVNSLASGIGSNDIGLDRGQLGSERLVKFIKTGNKLLLVQPNQNFRAITENALEKKSIEQAFATSVLFGFKIEDTINGNYVIDLTPFLMQDAHGVADRLKSQNEGTYKLDLSKSALSLERTKAFPKNVEFEALLTFDGEAKGRHIKSVTPTSSLISVIQHHSFVELPDHNYKPRTFDPRSGAISISYMDYATPIEEPIVKRFTIRHRLEKKNPELPMSEAVEPIIYYLDPGTPEPVRTALLEGGRWWNDAYEAIGFKDAFQIKMLPDDADPMDCRYNVIQWVHRSTRGWSYGASVVDPRTGEIIKGHVSLGSLRIRQDFMIAQAVLNQPFANSDANTEPMLQMALSRIRQLSAHEIGHTLGFAHNFAASSTSDASVMDYPHPKISLKDGTISLDNAYTDGIGIWDKITVAYSYSEFEEDTDEQEALREILKQAQVKGLRFISDSDARASGGAHAFAHLWDNGSSASEELERVLNVRARAISNFSKDNIRTYEPYSVLEDVFVPLYFLHRYQTEATSKLIGGLDYNYAVKGDGQLIMRVLEANLQKEALRALLNSISAETLAIPKDKLALFPPRAFGYGKSRESFSGKTGVSFDALSAPATASDMVLELLLSPQRANRLVQQKSLDKNQLGLYEVLRQLIESTFAKSYKDDYLNEAQQSINVNVLKYIMNLAVSDTATFQVQAQANGAIDAISRSLNDKKQVAPIYAAQYGRLISELREHPEKFKLETAPRIPDGSPIGADVCNYNSK
ncbi:zinc-dependent metalloprotease [Gelidibacter salicanalis]|uniref:Zinc-dependent metalloprotease n=1 Tax=Gelidibacter salicanalis TaxID=291193 RepID=A0A934KUZ8_9FLAO|nr:zinc-dependent metalloprotease [Gelidibacter salicanalis]MBJ7879895.1 zinc-dependent metalloprotease [Gelidibacter salicanalis]